MAASQRLTLEFAVLGTLIVHLLLFYGFRLSQSGTEAAPAAAETEALLLANVPEIEMWQQWQEIAFDESITAREKEIYGWSFWGDPTLLTLPHKVYGFAQIREDERVLPVQAIPAYVIDIKQSEEKALPEVKLAKPGLPLPAELSVTWTTAELQELEAVPQVPLRDGILWRYPDGKAIPDPLELEMARIRMALANDGLPQAATRIEINRDGAFTRLIVRQSSGNVTLDQLLVQSLTAELFIYEQAWDLGKTVDMRSFFPRENGIRVFEVEWRLLKAATEPRQQTGAGS